MKASAAIAAAGLATGGYALGIEPFWRLETRRYAVMPKSWPEGLSLKIAVLSDLHAGGPVMDLPRVEEIVATVNGLGADVIVLLGDLNGADWFRHYAAAPWRELARLLDGLRAPRGVFAIQGNHEYWDDLEFHGDPRKPTAMQRAFERTAIPLLGNQAVRLNLTGGKAWIAGISSQIALIGPRFGLRRRYVGLDDLPTALAMVTDDAPVILLAHEPDIFAQGNRRIALQLSGHTHGGQVRVFGWSPAVPSQYGNRYAYGHVTEGDRHLIVSGGLGTTSAGLAPVRFGVPPEVVLVEIGHCRGNGCAGPLPTA